MRARWDLEGCCCRIDLLADTKIDEGSSWPWSRGGRLDGEKEAGRAGNCSCYSTRRRGVASAAAEGVRERWRGWASPRSDTPSVMNRASGAAAYLLSH